MIIEVLKNHNYVKKNDENEHEEKPVIIFDDTLIYYAEVMFLLGSCISLLRLP